MNKQTIRRSIRQQRRALSARQQKLASQNLLRQLLQQTEFLTAKHIACYLACDGEIDLAPVIQQAWKMNKKVYLPVLHPCKAGHLWFVNYKKNTRMSKNIYGISEPDSRYAARIKAPFLSLVTLPLVAFDQQGGRLGMGGGYYDRSFAFIRKGQQQSKLIGCAHQLQQLDSIPCQAWDIPLHKVISDQAVY